MQSPRMAAPADVFTIHIFLIFTALGSMAPDPDGAVQNSIKLPSLSVCLSLGCDMQTAYWASNAANGMCRAAQRLDWTTSFFPSKINAWCREPTSTARCSDFSVREFYYIPFLYYSLPLSSFWGKEGVFKDNFREFHMFKGEGEAHQAFLSLCPSS